MYYSTVSHTKYMPMANSARQIPPAWWALRSYYTIKICPTFLWWRSGTPSEANSNAVLQVVKDDESLGTIALGLRTCYSIGRNDELCDISLLHPSASRKHAIIAHHQEEKNLMLMDLGSVQGTFLNDTRIEPHQPMKLSSTLSMLHQAWYFLSSLKYSRWRCDQVCSQLPFVSRSKCWSRRCDERNHWWDSKQK